MAQIQVIEEIFYFLTGYKSTHPAQAVGCVRISVERHWSFCPKKAALRDGSKQQKADCETYRINQGAAQEDLNSRRWRSPTYVRSQAF
jgi:hypothetical protein